MNRISILTVALIGIASASPARAQVTVKPLPSVSDREAVKADRAKADVDNQKNGTARPWDRDATGRRPWDPKPADGK